MKKQEPAPGTPMPRRTTALMLLGLLALGAVLGLAGCMATAPSTPAASLPSYVVHVPGNNHGSVLLVGRASCPHCADAKKLLANLSVEYYWVDLDGLDEANTTLVLADVKKVCSDVDSVPILIINSNPPCIIGYNETRIREALA